MAGSTKKKPAERSSRSSTRVESKLLRELFLGFVNVHVLHHASQGPIYGVWFLEELERHNYHLSPGTLYPLLHDLESSGFLKREDRVFEGKVRKYYEITRAGERALAEARQRIRELVEEVVEDDHSTRTRGRSAAS